MDVSLHFLLSAPSPFYPILPWFALYETDSRLCLLRLYWLDLWLWLISVPTTTFYFFLIAVDFCIMLDNMEPSPTRSVLSGAKTGVLSISDFANAGKHGYWIFQAFPLCFRLLSLERFPFSSLRWCMSFMVHFLQVATPCILNVAYTSLSYLQSLKYSIRLK